MTRPTDTAIARAFYEHVDKNGPFVDIDSTDMERRAIEIDAESKSAAPYCAACGGGPVYCIVCADRRGHVTITNEQVTTSPERAQIPAKSEHVAPYTPPDGKIACPIPTCRAELLPGQTCGGKECGLRRAE